MYATVDDYLADKDPAAVDVFRHVRAMILDLGGDVTEHVHASEISWSRGRSVRGGVRLRLASRGGSGSAAAHPPRDVA